MQLVIGAKDLLSLTGLPAASHVHQDLLSHWPEESKLFQLLSGVLATHNYLLGDLPFASREIGVRAIANPVCTSRAIQTSEPRSPMVNGQRLSPVRDFPIGKSI
jgi:hypothetical protein